MVFEEGKLTHAGPVEEYMSRLNPGDTLVRGDEE